MCVFERDREEAKREKAGSLWLFREQSAFIAHDTGTGSVRQPLLALCKVCQGAKFSVAELSTVLNSVVTPECSLDKWQLLKHRKKVYFILHIFSF